MNTATSQFDGHTPGPWQIDADTRYGASTLVFNSDGLLVADCEVGGDTFSRTALRAECERNARLIAAAPELLRQRDALLAALRGIMPEAVGWGNSLSHDDYADAARKAAKVLESIENGA